MRNRIYFRQLILVIFLLTPLAGAAQTTEFTYQGKLVDGGSPANANYDFEFRLFATAGGGGAIATQNRSAVPVANGIFTVQLDFGGQFDGANRWLEIAAKPVGSPNPLTVLTPRQPITSTPYSIRSLTAAGADVATNSLQLGGVNAGQYVLTNDARMTDARNPLPNSASYIRNSAAQQASSNFNISGNGTAGGTLSANSVNATTQYNIGGLRILSDSGTANLFAGVNTGPNNTTGQGNSFFGWLAGRDNTTGNNNSFFGSRAGNANTMGGANSFFGSGAGGSNTTSGGNSFFGNLAGGDNTTGNGNSFFGSNAGNRNTTGVSNSFFGSQAGFANATGSRNSFFGDNAGHSGNDNAFFGYNAALFNTANNNSFFGSEAGNQNTTGFNNAFFGRNAGKSNATGNGNAFFGNGAGADSTSSNANSFFGNNAGNGNTSGATNSFFGNAAGHTNTNGSNNTVIGANADVSTFNLSFATAIGAGAVVGSSNKIVLGRSAGQDLVVVEGQLLVNNQLNADHSIVLGGLGGGGDTPLCRNISKQISTCSSSLRYKTDPQPFTGGLNLINRLRPISFSWKSGGTRDVGFGAEDVERVEPLLVTYNDKGEIEGVKYGQVTTVLVNAVNEQQTQILGHHEQVQALNLRIEQQQKQIQQQQQAIDDLRKLVLRRRPNRGR